MFEFWIMIFIIVEINILKELGVSEMALSEQENIYQTFLRVFFNFNVIIFYLEKNQ